MYKFGKLKTPVLNCFGVSGVLSPEAEVLYESLFSTRHLGKVSDLISARLKEVGPDELKFRLVLLLGAFQAYRAQMSKKKASRIFGRSDNTLLDEPLMIECGVDSDKVALGINFLLGSDLSLNPLGISERVSKRLPANLFEDLLSKLFEQCDRLIFKVQSGTQRAEIICVLGVIGKISPDQVKNKQPLFFVSLDSENIQAAPPPKKYTHLGDLAYDKLLKSDGTQAAYATGQILKPGKSTEDSVEIPIEGDSTPKGQEENRIKGKATAPEEVVRVDGGDQELLDQSKFVVSGEEGDVRKSKFGLGSLFKGARSRLKGLIQQVVTSKPSVDGGQDVVVDMSEEEVNLGQVVVVEKPGSSKKAGQGFVRTGPPVDPPDQILQKLSVEIQKGSFHRTLENAQKQITSFDAEDKNSKAGQALSALVRSLATEKDRLHDLTKKVGHSLQVKEIEFKSKVLSLEEEVKRKNSLLAQKEKEISRLKELSESTQKKSSAADAGEALEESSFKHKYETSQRMLQLSKEENSQLVKRVDELRAELSRAESDARLSEGPSSAEYSALQAKYARIYRQAEEFKRANRQLMELLSDPRRERPESPPGNNDELKRRLEAAMKLATAARKENDTMKTRVAELQAEEKKLKEEVTRLEEALKQANSGSKGDSAA